MITTINRLVTEFKVLPGSVSDVKGARLLPFDLPQGSVAYADRGYSDYKHEDELRNSKFVELLPLRKKNSSRLCSP